jgi:riboflavin synthase
MFTGLIESVCKVKSANTAAGGGIRLAIELDKLASQCKPGDSVAVNGVCLTIAKLQGGLAQFDVSGETLARSTLGRLKSSSPVNVELAVKAGDRLGGHFVQGHIDGTAKIGKISREGRLTAEQQNEFARITFTAGAELLAQMVVKGSVAVDGVSLTIAALGEDSFSVSIIPETLKRTTLGAAKIGDLVNIETDIIVKTIKSAIDKILPKEQKLTTERLKELGF